MGAFRFRQFAVRQEQTAMKIGTDGVMLGAWAMASSVNFAPTRILDIGTGTGLLALMMAQRFAAASIEAIEIDAAAAAEAADNVEASPWAERIAVRHVSLADFVAGPMHDARFDLIVCNPPFYNATLKPADSARAVARHSDSLTPRDLMASARRLLTADGRLCFVVPTAAWPEYETEAIVSGLSVVRRCEVSTVEGRSPKRLLVELSPAERPWPMVEHLAIRRNDKYTEEYVRLVDSFYLDIKS